MNAINFTAVFKNLIAFRRIINLCILFRYTAIHYPFEHRQKFNFKTVKIIVAVTWLYPWMIEVGAWMELYHILTTCFPKCTQTGTKQQESRPNSVRPAIMIQCVLTTRCSSGRGGLLNPQISCITVSTGKHSKLNVTTGWPWPIAGGVDIQNQPLATGAEGLQRQSCAFKALHDDAISALGGYLSGDVSAIRTHCMYNMAP